MKKELYIGLDVHREAIAIAVAEPGRSGEVRDYGQISNDLHGLEKLIGRLHQAHGRPATLHVCYEAGPCGFGIARRLKQLGVRCEVVAPSLTPKRAGERLKTDRRDARKLARLLRAGELTAIYIPEPTDAAMRWTIGGAVVIGSKPSYCGTVIVIMGAVPGPTLMSVTCASWSCRIRR
jgi:transposase